MKKVFKKIIPLLLVFVFVVSAITLAGCTPAVKEITQEIDSVFALIASKSEIFAKKALETNQTEDDILYAKDYYKIDVGLASNINIDNEPQEVKNVIEQFSTYYDPIFSFAMSYITENKIIVKYYEDDAVPKNSKKHLEALDDAFDDMEDELEEFIEARRILIRKYTSTTSKDARLSYLRAFENQFAEFVGATVNASSKLATFVDSTGIMATITQNATDKENLKLYKNYVCTKMLPVVKDFYIEEFRGFNWKESTETETKTRINNLKAAMGDIIDGVFIDIYSSNVKTISDQNKLNETLDDLDKKLSVYMEEIQVAEKCLDYISINTLSVKYKNNLTNYTKDFQYADYCLTKLEQFVSYTTPNFLNYVKTTLIAEQA